MKTHQEIHDAIEGTKRLPQGILDVETMKILHALNDRIFALHVEFSSCATLTDLRSVEHDIKEMKHQLDDLNQTHE